MFGMGMPEILLILAIALIVIGPKKLPDLAKSLGRAMNEFKHAANEFKDSMELENDVREVKKTFDDVEAELKKKKAVEVTPKESKLDGSGAPATQDGLSVKPVETAPEEESPMPAVDRDEINSPADAPPDRDDEADEMHAATDIPAELIEEEEEKTEGPAPGETTAEKINREKPQETDKT